MRHSCEETSHSHRQTGIRSSETKVEVKDKRQVGLPPICRLSSGLIDAEQLRGQVNGVRLMRWEWLVDEMNEGWVNGKVCE